MIRVLKYLFIYLVVFALSCERRAVESPDLYLAYVPISIDWSESNMPDGYVANVTVYCYPKSGGAPYKQISGDIDIVIMELPIGEYSVLVINDVVGNVGGVNYLDEDSYDNFRVEATENPSISSLGFYYDVEADDTVLYEHDRVSSWSVDSFEVTIDMIEYTRSDEFSRIIEEARSGGDLATALSGTRSESTDTKVLESLDIFLDVKPQPVTSVVNMNINFKNLDNAQLVQGILKGTASGVYLSSRSESPHLGGRNVYPFNITEVVSGSLRSSNDATDGTLTYSLNTMGRAASESESTEEESYELQLDVILNTGVLKSYIVDVTDEMTSSDYLVNGEIDISLTDEDETVELPEATESGFGVSSWGDTESVILR